MIRNLFKILEFRKQGSKIIVTCRFPSIDEPMDIPIEREEFEEWLDETDRLNAEESGPDHRGEHEQRLYKLRPENYWEEVSEYKKHEHLYDYICLKSLEGEDVFEKIEDAFESILSEYRNKKS